MNKYISLAFNQAEENIAEDQDTHPGLNVYLTENLRDLDALTKLGANRDPLAINAHLQHLNSETLRAYLLIDLALGLRQRESKRRT